MPIPLQGKLFDIPRAPRPPAPPAPYIPLPDKQLQLWPDPNYVHLTQFQSPRLVDGIPNGPQNGNCGPASAVMGLRLLSLVVPGFHGEDSERVIDAARKIGTGNIDGTQWTDLKQNARVFAAAGAAMRPVQSFADVLAAVKSGSPVFALGNALDKSWITGPWETAQQTAKWGGHFVTISAPELNGARPTGRIVVNDPSQLNPVTVTPEQLRHFLGAARAAGGPLPRPAIALSLPSGPQDVAAGAQAVYDAIRATGGADKIADAPTTA